MIVTVTANPSLDRSAALASPIVRGQVHRLSDISVVAAGKGVNISRALRNAGVPPRAVVPAPEHDPLLTGMAAAGIDPQQRAEAVAPERYVALSDRLAAQAA